MIRHIDRILITSLLLVCLMGLGILYSAVNQDKNLMIGQVCRLIIAFGIMLTLSNISPYQIKRFSPWIYGLSVFLLMLVLIDGAISKGGQRWLNLVVFRFQPSELMKVALPLMLSWYFSGHPVPPRLKTLLLAVLMIIVPALLTAKQPDLGTALLMTSAGIGVIFLAGISLRICVSTVLLITAIVPFIWHYLLYGYQRERVMTFLSPERDPLGAGYHIIQSKIAIGSGGLFGKGYLNGSQSHLQFLPEHATDFIFAVCGEELGLMGVLALILLYMIILIRGLYISFQAQDTFSRLLSGSITLTFFFSVFINIGMVTGLLPVVGLPLPLVSYGGTSMITLMAGFGLLMSIHTHRRLIGS